MEPFEILIRAFRALTDRQLQRHAWHLERKTPVCCGLTYALYTDGKGGG